MGLPGMESTRSRAVLNLIKSVIQKQTYELSAPGQTCLWSAAAQQLILGARYGRITALGGLAARCNLVTT